MVHKNRTNKIQTCLWLYNIQRNNFILHQSSMKSKFYLTIWKNKRYLNPFHVQNLAPWISLHPLIGCSAWCAFIYTHRPYLLPAFLLASVKLFDNNNTRGSLNKIGVGWCWRRGFGEVVRFASRYKNQLYRSI